MVGLIPSRGISLLHLTNGTRSPFACKIASILFFAQFSSSHIFTPNVLLWGINPREVPLWCLRMVLKGSWSSIGRFGLVLGGNRVEVAFSSILGHSEVAGLFSFNSVPRLYHQSFSWIVLFFVLLKPVNFVSELMRILTWPNFKVSSPSVFACKVGDSYFFYCLILANYLSIFSSDTCKPRGRSPVRSAPQRL